MTIEEMIETLEVDVRNHRGRLSDGYRSIIAALRRLERLERAGQALRDKFEITVAVEAFDEYPEELVARHNRANGADLVDLIQAWDAATKG